MLDPQIYRVIITANKQTGLDLWKLAINAPTGMRGNPGANSRDSLRVSRRQVTSWSNMLRQGGEAGNNRSYRRDSREGRRVSEVVSVGEEACVRCGGGGALQTQVQAGAVPSPQQLRGPGGASYEGPVTDCPTKGKLRPVGTVRGGYNCVRGGRPSVDGRSLTAVT